MENKYGKADAERLLSETNDWIKACDNKSSILLTFLAILIGLTTDIFKAISIISTGINGNKGEKVLSSFLIILICIYFVLLGLSVFSLTSVLYARTKSMKKFIKQEDINSESPIFFGSIAKMGKEKFISKVGTLTEDNLTKEINEQIVINSKIAEIKFHAFNRALIFSILLGVVIVVTLAIIKL